MNNKGIIVLLILVVFIIATVIVWDFLSTQPGNRAENPFEFNMDTLRIVDEEKISHRETIQIIVGETLPVNIASNKGNIFLLTANFLQVITPKGKEISRFNLENNPACLTVTAGDTIIIGYENYLVAYNLHGEILNRSSIAAENAFFTAVVNSGNQIFVADAGSRQILVYNRGLVQTGAFHGQSGVSDLHGFILPGKQFDLAVNLEQELWAVNPGMHAVQNYTPEGRLRGHWRKSSFGPEGFSGCCNPSFIEFLSNGRLVTSEKGLVRIKIHNISGEFESFVAPPSAFQHGYKAPAIAVDINDKIIALDFDKNLIRIFEPI